MKKILMILSLLFCFAAGFSNVVQAQSQGIVIKGEVIDEKCEPIIGATVLFAGTQIGAITDLDGNFSLYIDGLGGIPYKAYLIISYIGYETQYVPIFGVGGVQIDVKVRMREDTEVLDEVVI